MEPTKQASDRQPKLSASLAFFDCGDRSNSQRFGQ